MNSRQILVAVRGGANEFIYKPGFVDDHSLESVKMAVDKELSLISNSFYKIAESTSTNQASLKVAYDQAILELNSLKATVVALTDRVTILEGKLP